MFGTLKSLFSTKKNVQLTSLAPLGVDMHSHLIANIDDGVRTIGESIDIILAMKDIGYRKIITTPHIMKGGYDNTPEIILSGLKDLRLELKKREIDFPIEAASEYYLDETFARIIKNEEEVLTFGDNYLLFELSYMTKPNNMKSVFFDMNISGYKPIMAHPERYPYLFNKNLDMYKEIKEAGIYLQLNLFSLVGYYGKAAQKIAELLVDEEMIDFVGTDIHNHMQLEVLQSCIKNEYVEKIINYEHLKNNTL